MHPDGGIFIGEINLLKPGPFHQAVQLLEQVFAQSGLEGGEIHL